MFSVITVYSIWTIFLKYNSVLSLPSMLYALRSALYVLPSTFYFLHSTSYSLQSTLYHPPFKSIYALYG